MISRLVVVCSNSEIKKNNSWWICGYNSDISRFDITVHEFLPVNVSEAVDALIKYMYSTLICQVIGYQMSEMIACKWGEDKEHIHQSASGIAACRYDFNKLTDS
jgi:hypothetical protein